MNKEAPKGMASGGDNLGEKAGFITDGYLDKKGTAQGEGAKFNYLPPGMEITAQSNAEFNNMPLKRVVNQSYPGDGWPNPRDIPE